MSQGANPRSDMDCEEARGQLMWAATLAGIVFGNAGVHAPHGMSTMVNAPCAIARDELSGLFQDALSYW